MRLIGALLIALFIATSNFPEGYDMPINLAQTFAQRPASVQDLIQKHAQRTGLPPELVARMIQRESGGRADALGDNGKSFGLMQIQMGAAKEAGFQGSSEDLMDPDTNIRVGTDYLMRQLNIFKDLNSALAAYNWGPSNVATGKPVPPSVQHYIDEVNPRPPSLQERFVPGSR